MKDVAKNIIEKAKTKSKKDWTGAKPDKDRFILPEEKHENCGTSDCCGECDTAVTEARGSDYTLYHKSYTDAINHALSHHGKSGLNVSDDDRFHHVGVMSKKPSEGNTTSLNIPATHTSGKKHMIHVQVFNKGGTHPYELNTYSSGMGRHVKEEAEQIDELSKSTLKSYINKATSDVRTSAAKGGYQAGLDVGRSKEELKKSDGGYSHARTALKRSSGISKAVDKLTKEEAESGLKKPVVKLRGFGQKKGLESIKNPIARASLMKKEEVELEEGRGADDKGHYRATEDGAGLTRKGAKAMGVKTAVTTPPSKLDPNGKAANRRKSFCARMGGMKGPMKDEKGRPTRKAMSLRRWNCNEEAEQIDEFMGKIPPPGPESIAHRKANTAMRLNVADARRKARLTKKKTAMEEFEHIDEELGKDNEWGRPELRKKFAAMTPGQEGMANDKIPEMNPFSGDAIHEEDLHEISALGAEKRSQYAAKLQKRLADPKVIARAKKEVAKKKAAEKAKAAEAPKHLVMQLRKATSIGSKVKFYDGSEHHVAPNHVEKFNDRYHSLKSSIEKEGFVKRAHKSHADFIRAISEETDMGQPMSPCLEPISSANYPTPDQVSPSPEIGDMNGDGMTNEWDAAVIEADITNEILNSDWEDLEYYYPEEGEDEDEDDTLDEGLTPQGRLRKKFAAMRGKVRRNMARNIQMKRIATPDRIKSRSIRAARNMVYKRLLRGRDRSSLSAGEKTRVEAQIKRMAPMVARLSVRLLQKERKRDQQRVVNIRTKKKK